VNITERALLFDCEGSSLVGVLAEPAGAAHETGVLIVVGGPQVRAGSHRQFVALARAAANAGFPALRFDVRGMGDSEGEPRDFTAIEADIAAAIGALQSACPGLRRIVLWGLCDAASASLMYWQARRDPRVAALALANPWVRSEHSAARAQVRHYYRDRLLQGAFWRKLLTGGVGAAAVTGLAQAVRRSRAVASAAASAPSAIKAGVTPKDGADFRLQMAQAWGGFPGPILLLLSGRDYTAKEFIDTTVSEAAWRGALARRELTRVDLPDADHTFSSPAEQRRGEAETLRFLAQLG
jgi:exosortase A-associated hydrolase 1